jgi:hypothetical protein
MSTHSAKTEDAAAIADQKLMVTSLTCPPKLEGYNERTGLVEFGLGEKVLTASAGLS